mgnify:CR=1 FL=1
MKKRQEENESYIGDREHWIWILYSMTIWLQRRMLYAFHDVEMHKRAFVLEPLHEIAPYKRHPVYGKTVREMLEDLRK